jgi:hypothetical protein
MPPRKTTTTTPRPRASRTKRPIDAEVGQTYNEFKSKFALVTKLRANIWLVTAVVLFMIGLLTGTALIVNPNSVLSGNIKGMLSNAAFLRSDTPTTTTYSGSIFSNIFNTGTSTPTTGTNTSTTCVRGIPRVTVSPTSKSIANGSSSPFVVSIVNTDNTPCGPSNFIVTHSVYGDRTVSETWNYTPASPSTHFNVAPGATVTSTVNVSPWRAAPGNYNYLFSAYHRLGGAGNPIDCALTGNTNPPATITVTGGPSASERVVNPTSPGCTISPTDPVTGSSTVVNPTTEGNNDATPTYPNGPTGSGSTGGSGGGTTTTPPPTPTNQPSVTLSAKYSEQSAYVTGSLTVDAGWGFKLKWDSTNASGCKLSDNATTQSADGEILHPPVSATTVISVTCPPSGGATSSITINTGSTNKTTAPTTSSPTTSSPTFRSDTGSTPPPISWSQRIFELLGALSIFR